MKKRYVGVERPAGLATLQPENGKKHKKRLTSAARLMLWVKIGSMMKAILRDMRSTLKFLAQCSASTQVERP